MTITGRITADAVVNSVKDERNVVNFSVAVTDRYRKRNGERVKEMTYYNCSLWRLETLAGHLKKGTLVEVEGRLFASAYAGKDGRPKASLNFRVGNIKILAWPKEVEVIGKSEPPLSGEEGADDLPF